MLSTFRMETYLPADDTVFCSAQIDEDCPFGVYTRSQRVPYAVIVVASEILAFSILVKPDV